MSLRFQRAIIVGGSSGMGAEMARQLSAEGVAVAIVGHRADEVAQVAERLNAAGKGRVIAATHDVRDYDDAPPLFDQLIYAAGIMYVPEEGVYDFGQDRAQMEINVVGAMAWTNIAAARFEAQRGGTIVGLSSIAGERGRRTMPGYTTSKAALTAWFEALRNRVARYGVNVVTVKPGVVDTPMTRDLVRKPPMMISAERAASLILATARRGGSPSAFIPARWGLVAMVLHHLPSTIFRRLDL
jgi:short-subunit dehydrogenase